MSCVYFLQAGDGGPIKIGFTKGEPKARIKSLQTASPLKLILIGVANGSSVEEKLLHYHLRSYRVAGEWFRPTSQVTEAMILAMNGEFPKKPEIVPTLKAPKAPRPPKPKRHRKFNPVDEIFDAFGGATSLARAIGLKPIHTQTMKTRHSIPVGYWVAVVEAAERQSIGGVTYEKLVLLHNPEGPAP